MAAVITQGIGLATVFSSANYKILHPGSRRTLLERRVGFFVVRSDGSLPSGLNGDKNRRGGLTTNAVATKQEKAASSTASNPGFRSHDRLME